MPKGESSTKISTFSILVYIFIPWPGPFFQKRRVFNSHEILQHLFFQATANPTAFIDLPVLQT